MEKDLTRLMEENLVSVWNERDANQRIKAIQNIYTADSNLYHVGHQISGQNAINESVSNIQINIPKSFNFFKLKPVTINNNIGRLIWGMGENSESIVSTGMDIAVFENGKIKSLYVFLE
ncbi:hypothetical protein MCETHM1_03394 [Flavobacteriaceae bacterium]